MKKETTNKQNEVPEKTGTVETPVTEETTASETQESTEAVEAPVTEETTADETQESTEAVEALEAEKIADFKKALELMKVNNVDTVYKAGKYWFTKQTYAVQFANKNGTSLETFNK